ncbi:MAG: CHAT domain-containing protein [Coleofasciculaceae cyanobacterium]
MSKTKIALYQVSRSLAVYFICTGFLGVPTHAQTITPALDGTGTIIAPNGNSIDITGGSLSGNNTNLFHSFSQFGLDPNQIANFNSQPNIINIFSRVVGGDVSRINGLIRVTGGNSNLFLMNPAGIIFGANSRLDVPASFTATTATSIGFGNSWFNASGTNNYTTLIGNPNVFAFTTQQPGVIINGGNLSVNGGDLTLIGGTVASTGEISAQNGQINISTVPGENLVRLSQVGQILSLEVRPLSDATTLPGNWALPVLALPELLTGGNGNNATGLMVSNSGEVELTGSGFKVENGDIVAKNITAQTATLSSNNNLTLVESQLATSGDLNLLAQNTVLMRDSLETLFDVQTGGNLNIQGNQSVNILAINHANPALRSGGNLSLATNNDNGILADGNFISGGNFSIINLASGNPGNFVSIFDPIIESSGNVSFGNYSGASLKIISSAGNVNIRNAVITRPSVVSGVPVDDPDFSALTSKRTLIIHAANGSITTGNIFTRSDNTADAGSIILTSQGNLVTGDIRTDDPINGDSGSVNLLSTQGNIITGGIFTNDQGISNAGSVSLTAANNITFSRIDTSKRGVGNAGSVTLIAQGNISDRNEIESRNFGTGAAGELIINPTTPIIPPIIPPTTPIIPQTPPIIPQTDTPTTLIPPTNTLPTPPTIPPTPTNTPTNTPTPNPNQNNQKPTDKSDRLPSLPQNYSPVSTQAELGSIVKKTSLESDPVYRLEEAFTKQFESHFQRQSNAKIYTSKDVQNRIRQLEQATGVKTGVIYVRFVPSTVAISETCSTSSLKTPSNQQDRRFGSFREQSSDAQQPECDVASSKQLEVLLISAEGEPIRQIVKDTTRGKVLAVTQEFQSALTNPKNVNTTSYLKSAQQLYQWIIAPIKAELQAHKIKNLVFAMDSGLRSLPLAALHDGKGFLVEQYSVNLVPSISLTGSRYRDVRSLQVLAMGASEFMEQAPLPGVKVELATITEQLWKGKSFLNDSFTLANFQAQRRSSPYGIVHLATHAEFRAGASKNSYIQFWDRKLRLNELDQLQLSDPPVELLVLSACRTALGNEQAELGFAGSAFQAGVGSTLATLWSVNDRGALGLTTEFYNQLSQVPIKSQALQRAQLAMIQGRVRIENNLLYNSGKSITLPSKLASANLNLSHPYYWAAFTLVGKP